MAEVPSVRFNKRQIYFLRFISLQLGKHWQPEPPSSLLKRQESTCYHLFQWQMLELSGFPGSTSGKEPACQCRRHKRLGFDCWVKKIPWRWAWPRTPVFLAGEIMEKRSLAGSVHSVAKSWTQLKQLSTHAHWNFLEVCFSLRVNWLMSVFHKCVLFFSISCLGSLISRGSI